MFAKSLKSTVEIAIRRSRDGQIIRWCWFGHEFSDKHVALTEEIAPRISDRHGLEELRLEATKVTARGAERLRLLFPQSKSVVFTHEEHMNGTVPDFHEGWKPEERYSEERYWG